MEQESSCNPNAQSPYAKGLMQFTDSTGEWAALTICRRLGKYDPFNPRWSISCGILYKQHLRKDTQDKLPLSSYCKVEAVTEQRYNGGSWVLQEIKRADSTDLTKARATCRRAKWACKENYEYPTYINKRQPKYAPLGGTVCTNEDTK